MGKGPRGSLPPEVADRPAGLLLCGAGVGPGAEPRWQDLPLLIGLQSWVSVLSQDLTQGAGKQAPPWCWGGPCPQGGGLGSAPSALSAPRRPES